MKAVIFDLDGVIFKKILPSIYRYLGKNSKSNVKDVKEAWKKHWNLAKKGVTGSIVVYQH